MKHFQRVRRTVVPTLALLLAVLPVVPARAASTFDPGDFTVTMTGGSGAGQQRPAMTCTSGGQTLELQAFLSNVAARWNGQGPAPAASCTSVEVNTFTNAALEGTVVNKNIGSGTISQTCDMRRNVTVKFDVTVAAGSPNTVAVGNFASSMDGFQACAWAMRFADAKSSRLSGTIEQTYGFSSAGAVPCNGSYADLSSRGKVFCVEVQMNAKVWVVGGAGEFASTGGTGTFSSGSLAPIVIPTVTGVTTQSLNPARMIEIVDLMLPGANSADSANNLKMTLIKGAKATVRMVSPAKEGNSRTLGAGADGTGLTKVKVSAAPGAKCGITAKAGSTSKSVAPAKTDADGMIATAVTSATLKSKLAAKSGAKVVLSVYCAVGSKTVTTNQTVTLGD